MVITIPNAGSSYPLLLVITLHDLTWYLSHARLCAWIIEVILKLSPGRDKDEAGFEAHPTPSRGHTTGVQKWYMVRITTIEPARQVIAKRIQCAKREEPPLHEPASSRKSGNSEMRLSALQLKSFRASFQSTVRVDLSPPLWVWVWACVTVWMNTTAHPPRRAKAFSPPRRSTTTTRMTMSITTLHLQF